MMSDIKKLSKRIDSFKKKKVEIKTKINEKSNFNYSVAINISIELITGIGLGVFFGIMLDNYLQTKPLMFIICFILGTIVGFYNMYRTLKKYSFF